jgi:hypothetical protein
MDNFVLSTISTLKRDNTGTLSVADAGSRTKLFSQLKKGPSQGKNNNSGFDVTDAIMLV